MEKGKNSSSSDYDSIERTIRLLSQEEMYFILFILLHCRMNIHQDNAAVLYYAVIIQKIFILTQQQRKNKFKKLKEEEKPLLLLLSHL